MNKGHQPPAFEWDLHELGPRPVSSPAPQPKLSPTPVPRKTGRERGASAKPREKAVA
jgi:hypothetical protein